jgi:hypothetical protein
MDNRMNAKMDKNLGKKMGKKMAKKTGQNPARQETECPIQRALFARWVGNHEPQPPPDRIDTKMRVAPVPRDRATLICVWK